MLHFTLHRSSRANDQSKRVSSRLECRPAGNSRFLHLSLSLFYADEE